MFEFINMYTGQHSISTVDQMFFMLEGRHETILNKADCVSSYGWYWDETKMLG